MPDEFERSLCVLQDRDDGLARLLSSWIIDHQYVAAAAALCLEPLDAMGSLSDADKQRWDDLLDRVVGVPRVFTLNVSNYVAGAVRENLLRDSPDYASWTHALAEPLSPEGVELRKTLARLDDGGWEPGMNIPI